jgi:CPA2 family monovalent cation:H+ antiporter-2
MPHSTSLIGTIVVSLVLAFGCGFVASRLRLPPLVGYLLAGIAVGPFTPGFVADLDLAGQLAEIGVILLMFGIGLHFSIADLLAVYTIALPGALAQMAVSVALCTALVVLWGWSLTAGLLLGVALSVASTVVLLRILEERRALDKVDGRIAIGWLIVQDIVMVLVLVLLPALAGSSEGSPSDLTPRVRGEVGVTLAITGAKVAAFVALVLVVGKRLVPWLLDQVARTGSRELFTLSVLAAALGIAYGSAELFGVSFALGAFFAGVVLSESDLSHQAAADSLPLRDAFAVLFFISVGMLFDPLILLQEPLRILAVLAVIVVAKAVPAIAIVLAFRYPVASALTVSAGLAQIGEFSFILAGFGVGLGLLPPEGRDLILAGALLSITLNPLAFIAADRSAAWLRARPTLLARLERSGDPRGRGEDAELKTATWQGHAIIVGHGRVGSPIGRALQQQGLPYIVVEHDRRRVRELRARGQAVVWGDAAAAGVLEAAHVRSARLLVIAAPDAFQARRILDVARRANPRIDTVARAHADGEMSYLERQGVGMAVMGERELALGMADYALRSLGLSEDKARRVVQGLRVSGEAAHPRTEP